MKKFYLQVQSDGIITDAISFPYEDYVEVELEYLPTGVYGGWWKLENGELVEYPELKPIDQNDEIEMLKAENTQLKLAMAEMAESNEVEITNLQLAIAELADIVESGE